LCGMVEALPRVALVDDDASVRKALGRALSASSFEITTFCSATEFLKSLEVQSPQCLVVDIHMPDITGLDLRNHLARVRINIPTIVITALNKPGLRERCQSEGAAAFLVKPFDVRALIAEINSAIHQG